MGEKLGVMLCGHGSRDEGAVREFARLSGHLSGIFSDHPVEYGYLEFATPIIRTGLDRLREQGVTRVLAVPGMLFAAGHAKNDIPSVLNEYAAGFDNFDIEYGKELGMDPKMMRAAAGRVQEAIDGADNQVAHSDTLLVVVGRGASDPDANSNVSKVMRLLWEGFGFGWGEVAYSGVTFPLVEPALERACRLGFKRIIVFPYFLFSGVLVNRIYNYTDLVASRHPEVEFIKASYLNDHPLVVETFKERVEQILNGDSAMNCALCKYRTQVFGFEDEVGLPQQSHHHHVEGIGTSHAEAHHHDHSHDHDHHHGHGDHSHHSYPHADHPFGPNSMRK